MKIFSKLLPGIVLSMILLGTAKKNDVISFADNEMADLTIQFDNNAGRQDLVLNTADYTNAAGESFNISQLQYFVSNIRLMVLLRGRMMTGHGLLSLLTQTMLTNSKYPAFAI